MKPSLRCLYCRQWCVVEEDIRYCAKCGRLLGVEDFAELIRLNDEATKIKNALMPAIQRYYVMMMGAMMLTGLFSVRWQHLGIMVTFIVLGSACLVASGLKWLSIKRRLKSPEYQRLWFCSANFRPSVPKP